MFISSIKIKGRPEKRIEILQTISGVSDQVKLKTGCFSAHCYQDINDENSFCLIDVWHTHQALNEHLGSKLFAALLGINAILIESPEIKILVEDCSFDCDEKENIQVH